MIRRCFTKRGNNNKDQISTKHRKAKARAQQTNKFKTKMNKQKYKLRQDKKRENMSFPNNYFQRNWKTI